MGLIIILILFIGLCGFLSKRFEFSSCDLLAQIFGTFVGIALIFFIVCGIITQANKQVNYQTKLETRERYVELYNKYNQLSSNDVTASDSYKDIVNDIIDFNDDIRSAKKWSNTFMMGIYYNDKYVDIPLVEE